jgi:exodeoxyribonuclease VII large subunit
MGHAASRSLLRRGEQVRSTAGRLRPASERALAQRTARLDHLGALSAAHDPRLALARGWSITRDDTGRALRSVSDAAEGATLWTELSDGRLRSEVTGREDGGAQGGDPP